MTNSPIIDRYCNYLTLIGRSKLTIEQYETDLLMFFRYIACKNNGLKTDDENMEKVLPSKIDIDFVRSVTNNDVYEFLRYVTEVRQNKTSARARKLSSIKSFYKYLTNTAMLCEYNPAEAISTPAKPKRLPKYLTVEESTKLLQAIRDDSQSKTIPRDFAMITLFLNCGMRLSELVGISIADLDPQLKSLRVIGKGSKERIVYLNTACRTALIEYLKFRETMAPIRDKNALFLSLRTDRISNKTVQHIVKKYLALAGLEYKHYSTHKLRHTAATLMYQSGKVDVRVLKDILGHEQLNTTQIYTHTSNSQMEEAMENSPLADIKIKKNT